MKHSAIQTHINPKVACKIVSESAIPLEKLVHPDDKVCKLEKLINWQYLETQLSYLFKGENAPSPRLIFGLLYLQSIDNLPYSDVIAIWKRSPEWQYFCGQRFLDNSFPLHEASLSIWSRVIGEQGRQIMTQALGLVEQNETIH